jgi:hypothetical protein
MGTVTSVLLALPIIVGCFNTIESDMLNQHSEHERITRLALACPPGSTTSKDCFEPRSLDQLAGNEGTFGGVGAPDTPPPEGPEAHCDDADFFDEEDYPRTREAATAALQKCVTHLRRRMEQGITDAAALLNSNNQIISAEVSLGRDCTFGPFFMSGRAKCNALEGLGRALHGVQDFYAHSNWADVAEPPFSPVNPPGLNYSTPAPLMDLRSRAPIIVERDLSTGCFAGPLVDLTPGFLSCTGRITHNTINKDGGLINAKTGVTSFPNTMRGQIADNFDRAVQVAIEDTRRQWQHFRSELRSRYGPLRASLMICALRSDIPQRSCQGRRIAIVLESDNENDPSDLRVAAAKSFSSMLVNQQRAGDNGRPDLVTVVAFAQRATVIYPLGDPSIAAYALDEGIDVQSGRNIAKGVRAAIGELTKHAHSPTANTHRSGIVVLTSGGDEDAAALVHHLARARALGIRVSIGHLRPGCDESSLDLVAAVVQTRGIYCKLGSPEALQSFIDLVVAHGPTDLDDGGGAGSGVALLPGLSVAAEISDGPSIFTYNARAGETLSFEIRAMGKQRLEASLRDVRSAIILETATTDLYGHAVIALHAVVSLELELLVTAAGVGLFEVGLESSAWQGITPKPKPEPAMEYPNATCPHVVKTVTVLSVFLGIFSQLWVLRR